MDPSAENERWAGRIPAPLKAEPGGLPRHGSLYSTGTTGIGKIIIDILRKEI
jgi:hypothetical protein